PDDRAAWRLLARAEGRRGRAGPAQSIYRQRLGLEALDAEDFVIAPAGLARPGQPDPARVALAKARDPRPGPPGMAPGLARLDAAEDRPTEAAELAGRLASRPGWGVRGWLLLGQVREALHDPAGEAEAIGRALRFDPTLADPVRKRLARALLQA